MGRKACDVFAVENDFSLVWTVYTGKKVEYRGFPCAVGTYDAPDVFLVNIQVEIGDSLQSSKGMCEI
jgi:hypothetical protein